MKHKVIETISRVTSMSSEAILGSLEGPISWDSFTQVELVLALEDTFSIEFTQMELEQFRTPGEIVNLVMSKSNE